MRRVRKDCRILYDPSIWPELNSLVHVDPNWAILPVRFKQPRDDHYTIAVTPLQTPQGRWYTLADVLASIVLGGPAPVIRQAIRFVPKGRCRRKQTEFRNAVPLNTKDPIFKVIVEQKQLAKGGAAGSADLAGLEIGLKQMANSGSYGIYAEVNVSPSADDKPLSGSVYSDICYRSAKVHDEKPGAFTNPIIASLITGGARLMLAMLEAEVNQLGGTFAFCDTDSLAIVCGEATGDGIPSLPKSSIDEIDRRFDSLSP